MIQTSQFIVFFVLHLVVLVICVVALVDAARRPAAAFVSAGKRTKNFWVAVTAAAAAVSFVAMPPTGIAGLRFLVLIAAVAGIVYLVDVRPAVTPYSGRRGPRGGSPRGGW